MFIAEKHKYIVIYKAKNNQRSLSKNIFVYYFSNRVIVMEAGLALSLCMYTQFAITVYMNDSAFRLITFSLILFASVYQKERGNNIVFKFSHCQQMSYQLSLY